MQRCKVRDDVFVNLLPVGKVALYAAVQSESILQSSACDSFRLHYMQRRKAAYCLNIARLPERYIINSTLIQSSYINEKTKYKAV